MRARVKLLLISLILIAYALESLASRRTMPGLTVGTNAPADHALATANTQRTAADEVGSLVDDPARIAAAVPAERDPVALAEAFNGLTDIPRVARAMALDVEVGEVETFWVSDELGGLPYTVTATLRYAGPIALIYVDTAADVGQAAIER